MSLNIGLCLRYCCHDPGLWKYQISLEYDSEKYVGWFGKANSILICSALAILKYIIELLSTALKHVFFCKLKNGHLSEW